jgi:hypothetical protein
MKFLMLLTVIYICIIIFQILYIKYALHIKNIEHEEKIKFNRTNITKIMEYFKKILNERLNLLHSNKMNYNEWINYNKKNLMVYYDKKHKYYIFLFDVLSDKNYIQRVSANYKLINVSWNDILKVNNEQLIYTKFTTDRDLIKNFYESSTNGEFSEIKYYWLDPITVRSVAKKSIVARWDDAKSGKTGVIGVGLDIEYIDDKNAFLYFKELGYVYPVIISVVTFIVSVVLYKLKGEKNSNFKAVLFLLITNAYLIHFLSKREIYGSNELENKKEQNINSGILSISFLVGVNIFILTTLQKSFKKDLFTESGFIFAISLILLLIATLKNTNYMSTNDVIKSRLVTQLIFNFAIILNTLIVFNYIIYILSIKLLKTKFTNGVK